MRNVAVLSVLSLALCLSACGSMSRTPDPETAKALPAPATQVAAPFEIQAEAGVLERTGLILTLEGRTLVLTPGLTPISIRLKLPDGTYSPSTGGAAGQALTSPLKRDASLGLVVEVGQGWYEKAATVALKPRR